MQASASPRCSTAAAGVAWRIVPSTQLTGLVRYVGHQRYDNEQSNTFQLMPSYTLVDLKLTHTIRKLTLGFAVNNVFNNPYREPMSFIDEPGRAYSFSLKREFQVPLTASTKERGSVRRTSIACAPVPFMSRYGSILMASRAEFHHLRYSSSVRNRVVRSFLRSPTLSVPPVLVRARRTTLAEIGRAHV